jgi:hypothetical protein
MLSVLLRFRNSDYPFGIFKLFFVFCTFTIGYCIVCPSSIYRLFVVIVVKIGEMKCCSLEDKQQFINHYFLMLPSFEFNLQMITSNSIAIFHPEPKLKKSKSQHFFPYFMCRFVAVFYIIIMFVFFICFCLLAFFLLISLPCFNFCSICYIANS